MHYIHNTFLYFSLCCSNRRYLVDDAVMSKINAIGSEKA